MKQTKKQTKYFYMFISPWLAGFFLLTFIPLAYSIYLSFTQYNGLSAPELIGIRNYSDILFHDDLFRKSLKLFCVCNYRGAVEPCFSLAYCLFIVKGV